MTVLLIAGGISSTLLMAGFAYVTGVMVGTRRGVDIGFRLGTDLYEEDQEEDPFMKHYGGMIDAGRRGEN